MTTQQLNFINQEEALIKEEHKGYETIDEFLPAGVKFPSEILSLEQLYWLYMMLEKFI